MTDPTITPPAGPTPAVTPPSVAPTAPAAPAPPAVTPPPAAPTLPPVVAGGPSKPASKLKPVYVIGAIVGAVTLVGAISSLVGGSQDADARPGATVSAPLVPLGSVALDPSAGPQPAAPVEPEPLPGPGTEPVITTTTAPPPTTPPPPAAAASGGVEIGDGVGVSPAQGWSVTNQATGFVQLDADSGAGQLYLSLFDESLGSSVEEAASNYINGSVVPFLAELETGGIQSMAPLSSNVVANGHLSYTGVLASQNGNVPMEGFLAVFVRSDGSVLVYEETNVLGSYGELDAAYTSMFNSIIPTL